MVTRLRAKRLMDHENLEKEIFGRILFLASQELVPEYIEDIHGILYE